MKNFIKSLKAIAAKPLYFEVTKSYPDRTFISRFKDKFILLVSDDEKSFCLYTIDGTIVASFPLERTKKVCYTTQKYLAYKTIFRESVKTLQKEK